MKQNRWKSPVVYMALAGQVLALLTVSGVIDPDMNGNLKVAVSLVLEALTVLGILNNPTDAKGF